jgi:hypothetical protein
VLPGPRAYDGRTMKTGRLLKFHRPGGDVQAYLYQEGEVVRATVYLFARDEAPVHELCGTSDDEVEAAVRDWIDSRFPRDVPR